MGYGQTPLPRLRNGCEPAAMSRFASGIGKACGGGFMLSRAGVGSYTFVVDVAFVGFDSPKLGVHSKSEDSLMRSVLIAVLLAACVGCSDKAASVPNPELKAPELPNPRAVPGKGGAVMN